MSMNAQHLQVTIKRIDTTLPLPTYATGGSVAFDLVCREETEIAPRKLGYVPGNVIVQTPPGLLVPHGGGIIDQDYCGEGDELTIQVYNFRDEAVTVQRGERIAQGMFVPVLHVEWNEVDAVGKGRGGFGSTGS